MDVARLKIPGSWKVPNENERDRMICNVGGIRDLPCVIRCTHARTPTGSREKRREWEMRVGTLITFVNEHESKKHNRKQEEDKIREKQTRSALDTAQRYYRSSKECWNMYLLRK